MKIIKGDYCEAVLFTVNNESHSVDQYAEAQIKRICDNEIFKDSKIRIMPDVHAGKVGPIGLTMYIDNYIMPNLLGVDIGCGVKVCKLNIKNSKMLISELQKLDVVIRDNIPSGFKNRKDSFYYSRAKEIISDLNCKVHVDKISSSLGSLGG